MNTSHSSNAYYSLGFLLAVLFAGGVLVNPLYAQSSSSPTGTLTVHVDGLESDNGAVRIELTTAENYTGDGNVRADALPVQNGTARWTVEEVPFGTYAVALYHDENGDGNLETNMIGAPQEAYGFSNNARGTLRTPPFASNPTPSRLRSRRSAPPCGGASAERDGDLATA